MVDRAARIGLCVRFSLSSFAQSCGYLIYCDAQANVDYACLRGRRWSQAVALEKRMKARNAAPRRSDLDYRASQVATLRSLLSDSDSAGEAELQCRFGQI